VHRKTPLFPYSWWIRAPSPQSLIALYRKDLWRMRGGNKGQLQSMNPMREPAARTTSGVGRWMTIPTLSIDIFRHSRLRLSPSRELPSGSLRTARIVHESCTSRFGAQFIASTAIVAGSIASSQTHSLPSDSILASIARYRFPSIASWRSVRRDWRKSRADARCGSSTSGTARHKYSDAVLLSAYLDKGGPWS